MFYSIFVSLSLSYSLIRIKIQSNFQYFLAIGCEYFRYEFYFSFKSRLFGHTVSKLYLIGLDNPFLSGTTGYAHRFRTYKKNLTLKGYILCDHGSQLKSKYLLVYHKNFWLHIRGIYCAPCRLIFFFLSITPQKMRF